jgi:hypothetical protein
MKPVRTTQTDSPIRVALTVSFLSLAACTGAALYSIVAAPAQGSTISTLFPTALSLFPVVGLVAAVAFTQLLKRRRVPQLQAIAVDRS